MGWAVIVSRIASRSSIGLQSTAMNSDGIGQAGSVGGEPGIGLRHGPSHPRAGSEHLGRGLGGSDIWTSCRCWMSAVVLVAVVSGCTLSGGGSDGWSRTYTRSFDRVWQATLSTLAEEDYLVEVEDRERGRLVAASSARRRDREILLEIRVKETTESVRVDVQARPGPVDGPVNLKQMENTVLPFLLALDQELRAVVSPSGDDGA